MPTLKFVTMYSGLILESSRKEAVAVDLTSGVSLFDRVRQDVEQIKRPYDEEASQQLVLR